MPVSRDHTTTNALEVRGVGRCFGAFWAVQDISLTVRPGERRAILGPNGAGKTTLFNVLTGDLAASSGTIAMNGLDVTRMPMHRRIKAGLRRTYQHAHLFDGLTVRETLFLAVSAIAGGWGRITPVRPGDGAVAKAEHLARLAGLENDLGREVASLSHGQRRQLEIGMALAESPRILLLDEPAAGLSPSERPRLAALLLNLPRDITIVLIEHDMDIALKTSDSVTVMHNGRLLAEGGPKDIMSNDAVHDVYMGGANVR
ncbi:MAG: ABC transporter ATP-binding protein [Rhodobacteraceae bacterium]|nr:ABC transporter ATP-binding protein [Paracoccaceae bacterium]